MYVYSKAKVTHALAGHNLQDEYVVASKVDQTFKLSTAMAVNWYTLRITNISANDLKDVRLLFDMKVYGYVSLISQLYPYHNAYRAIPVDCQHGTSPRWDRPFDDLHVHYPCLSANRLALSILFFCKRTLGDRFVGSATVPVSMLVDCQALTFPVKTISGEAEGMVTLSCQFLPYCAPLPPPQYGIQGRWSGVTKEIIRFIREEVEKVLTQGIAYSLVSVVLGGG